MESHCSLPVSRFICELNEAMSSLLLHQTFIETSMPLLAGKPEQAYCQLKSAHTCAA